MRRGAAIVATVVILAATLPARAQRGVRVDDNLFDPPFVVVGVGTTVVWEHAGSAPHSVTSQPGAPEPFDSHPTCSAINFLFCMQSGETFSRRFDRAGTFAYYCKVHGRRDVSPDPDAGADEQPCEMCGIIQVGSGRPSPSPSPSPSPRPSPTPTRSPTAGPTAGPTATPTVVISPTGPVESPTPGDDDGGGAGGRVGLAVLGVIVLGGAGYLVWRGFIAGR